MIVPILTFKDRENALTQCFGEDPDEDNSARSLQRNKTMKRSASALWQGGLKEGQGTVSTESGALKETPYFI